MLTTPEWADYMGTEMIVSSLLKHSVRTLSVLAPSWVSRWQTEQSWRASSEAGGVGWCLIRKCSMKLIGIQIISCNIWKQARLKKPSHILSFSFKQILSFAYIWLQVSILIWFLTARLETMQSSIKNLPTISSLKTAELVKLAGRDSKNTCRNRSFFRKYSNYKFRLEFIQKQDIILQE